MNAIVRKTFLSSIKSIVRVALLPFCGDAVALNLTLYEVMPSFILPKWNGAL